MARHPLTGTRIREKRMDIGLRQADLAVDVGISPSYLNLIEHNKRRIGGKLLADIARSLAVEPAMLTEGADTALLDQLRGVAAEIGANAEVDRTEELATRYPGWAALIAEQADQTTRLRAHVQTLTDRMSHDPLLAAALHDVISAVTSIRSTAAILVGDDKIDADWQRRFHQNIHDDSLRLATESEALVNYLDAPKAEGALAMSPLEEAESLIAQSGYTMPELETGKTAFQDIISKSNAVQSVAGAVIAHKILGDYAQLVKQMPLDAFSKAARSHAYDPAKLAAEFKVDLASVFRRLASLDPAQDHPPIGLATCDAAGVMTFFKPVPGFSMLRNGAACPLWPLYASLSQPGHPIRIEVALPDANSTRLLCYTVASPIAPAGFDAPPPYTATMIVMPDPPAGDGLPLPVGISCRICPRENCVARREPSVLRASPIG